MNAESDPSDDRFTHKLAATLVRCRRIGSRLLDLSGMNLKEIPPEIFELHRLRYVDLSNNQLRSIPAQLSELHNLESVNLIGNPIETLCDRSGLYIDSPTYRRCCSQVDPCNVTVCLAEGVSDEEARFWTQDESVAIHLQRMSIRASSKGRSTGRALYEIAHSIGRFRNLRYLELSNVDLPNLPHELRHLGELRFLHLNNLGLSALPVWIEEFSLERLSAHGNRLASLPDGIRNIRGLKSLSLSNNPIRHIPRPIFDLRALEHLDLDGCQIREIPIDILQLRKLKYFSCGRNSIESPPREVVDKGIEAIRDYWRQREEKGVDFLCEAKLIILGEAGAGKTSLAQKIKNPKYNLRKDEKSTEGIDVVHYEFPAAVRTQESGNERILNCQFQVNIWDFGGQEIYHATHQFFLTRRSVYVLVCDDRKEDTDFSYWLQVVEMLTDGSPLWIVQNEKQDRSRDINLANLRARFANLRGAISTNLDNNRGLENVVRMLRQELEHLPHIGAGLPATWKRVREALERDSRDYVSLDEFLAICQQNGFTRREDKLQLSGYLHDLGICLHFQDDGLLKNTVILKPAWGTDAVYRVLDDSQVIADRGHFTNGSLKRIWSESKYSGMQDELLQLMMKFQLCYALGGGRDFIAPQRLSSEQPAYAWDPIGNLVIRYQYEFLPKGILTRFIVGLHRLISGNKVWRTGVVLERDGAQAEIVEEYAKNRIRVRMSGANPVGLLSILDEQLQRLHDSFPRLQCERYLSCPCTECQVKAEPDGFPLEKLIQRAKKNQQIQCHSSGEMVDPVRLVNDVLPGAVASASLLIDQLASPVTAERELCSMPSPPAPEVFVSYGWTEESSAIVDRLQETLGKEGVRLLRDQEEVRYKDSIREFMRRIGLGKCVVVVISEKYLKSENCMFELLEVAKAESLRERIFPIVLPDANIYKATGRVAYLKYWEDQIEELNAALRSVRGENTTNLQSDLNLYAEIRRLFDVIVDTLRDMNALTPGEHADSSFEELIRRILAQVRV